MIPKKFGSMPNKKGTRVQEFLFYIFQRIN